MRWILSITLYILTPFIICLSIINDLNNITYYNVDALPEICLFVVKSWIIY
jgi:hypothetical protein